MAIHLPSVHVATDISSITGVTIRYKLVSQIMEHFKNIGKKRML